MPRTRDVWGRREEARHSTTSQRPSILPPTRCSRPRWHRFRMFPRTARSVMPSREASSGTVTEDFSRQVSRIFFDDFPMRAWGLPGVFSSRCLFEVFRMHLELFPETGAPPGISSETSVGMGCPPGSAVSTCFRRTVTVNKQLSRSSTKSMVGHSSSARAIPEPSPW